MDTWVYLNNDDALPRIFKNAYPGFIGTIVVIWEDKSGEATEIAEFLLSDIHHITVKVEDE